MILTLQKLLQKAKQVSDPRDAHALALDLIESMLRHYAVVAIAAYRHTGAKDPKINRILSEQLPRPSMGSWKNFLQMLAATDKEHFPEHFREKFLTPLTRKVSYPDISAAYAGLRRLSDQDVFAPPESPVPPEATPCTSLEFFDAAVAYRNRFAGHGTHELPEAAVKFAPQFLKGVAALCTHLNTLWVACPVYLTKQAKLYGRTFFRLTPLVKAEGIGELQAAAHGMEEDRLYICFGDRKHPDVESLYPAALWEDGDILFANGTRGLIDIHYIGYASQRSFETSIYEEDYRNFLKPFTIKEETPSVGSTPTQIQETNPSIAVLPFVNMSAEPEQEYFCDGITEEIINALSRVKDLKVIARTSAFVFKHRQEDIREIGNKLDVDNLLEGSVRKAGNRLRITTQLIRVEDGSHLWSERFDRVLEDVFSIQDEISLSIVEALKIKLMEKEKASIVRRRTEDTEAYSLYLKGRYFWNKRTETGFRKCVVYYKSALNLNVDYAPAYAGLADAFFLLGFQGDESPSEAFPKAKSAALEALERDQSLAEAHISLGCIYAAYDHNWPKSQEHFQIALHLKPNLPMAHYWYAIWYLLPHCQYDYSISEIKEALNLDPLSFVINTGLGWNFYFTRKYKEAIPILKEVLEFDQKFIFAHDILGQVYTQLGMFEQAEKELEYSVKLSNRRTIISLSALGYIYTQIKKIEKAEKIIAELEALSQKKFVSGYHIALIYAGMDRMDRAMFWLEQAYSEKNGWLVFLNIEPKWDNMKSDKQFNRLKEKIGLP